MHKKFIKKTLTPDEIIDKLIHNMQLRPSKTSTAS
jgi:hypothetical protein